MICRWARNDSAERSGIQDEEKKSTNRTVSYTIKTVINIYY
jgi:hypothetical protein